MFRHNKNKFFRIHARIKSKMVVGQGGIGMLYYFISHIIFFSGPYSNQLISKHNVGYYH